MVVRGSSESTRSRAACENSSFAVSIQQMLSCVRAEVPDAPGVGPGVILLAVGKVHRIIDPVELNDLAAHTGTALLEIAEKQFGISCLVSFYYFQERNCACDIHTRVAH